MGPRPAQNRERKEPTPEAPAAAVRYAGVGFLLGFLLCAILAGILMWLLRRPTPPPIVLHPPPTACSYGDAQFRRPRPVRSWSL